MQVKLPKIAKLIVAAVLILLFILCVVWIGGFWSNQSKAEDKDELLKGYRLSMELKFEEAYGCFNMARTLAHVYGDEDKELKALKGMADCAFWIGAVDSCIIRYNQALALAHSQKDVLEKYDIYTKLKQAYMAKVDMQAVLRISQKIDSLLDATNNTRLRMDIQQNLAIEALQQQNVKLAESYLLTNEHLLDSLSASEKQSAMYTVYGYLRDFYFGQQDLKKARKYSQLYIQTGKNGLQQHQLAYMTYDTEAIICAQQKERDAAFEALDSMKYGLTLSNGASEVNVMHYHDIKGRVHAILGEWTKACDEYKKALAVIDGTYASYRIDYFRIMNLLGTALFQCKKYNEARNYFADFARYCRLQYGEGSLAFADALYTMANLEGYDGKTEVGKQYYVKSVDICKRLVSEQLKYISVQERETFWLAFAPKMWGMTAYAIKTGERQSRFTENCYDALLFSKSLLLESDRRIAATINSKCTSEEKRLYYEILGLQNRLKSLLNDYDKNKKLIDELHKRISHQNRQLTPIISKLGYTSFLNKNYNDIRESLKDNEVLLDFTDYYSDEQVQQFAAFVIHKGQSHPKLAKLFTEEMIKILLAGKPADFLYKEPYASKVINIIWEPLSREVIGKKTIYYVPSGILHRIALEYIPLSDGTLLGEHYHFVRLSSAREITKTRVGSQIGWNATATLYGALKYDMDNITWSQEASNYRVESLYAFSRDETRKGTSRFRYLPNTREEINKIKGLLESKRLNVIVQTGTKGTEESFLALSGKAPKILHMATHGFYYTPEKARSVSFLNGYSDAMSLSGLIMSGGNRAWTGESIPKGVLGGVLTASSIATLDLRGTDLLVLSACQTGLGVATHEGIYGLQRAFKKAGVQTMIMTLWNINDEVAKEFMIKFYEELTSNQNNSNKRLAFEKAQKYIRSKKRYKDPYYWAGFIMLD